MIIKPKRKLYQSILFRISMVLLVMVAQLIWWIVFTIQDTQKQIDQINLQLKLEQKLAQNLLDNSLNKSETINYIQLNFSNLLVKESQIIINEIFRSEAIKNETDKRFMFISESSLFFVFILLSIYLVYRSFKEEFRLRLLQQNFMLSITHELKTPIASIKLYLQTLQNKPNVSSEKHALFLENGISEVNRLNELIENILYTVKLETEPSVLNETNQNLSDIVQQIIGKNEQLFSITIMQKIESNLFHTISTQAIELILNNLISNAVKYSNEQSDIIVTLERVKEELILSVSDNGLGVPDSEKQLIFNRFYRIGDEENREEKGTGIGLYIVKQIVRLAKGRVYCKDNKPNGSIFIIKLENGTKRED